MRILALDSSTVAGSVALADGARLIEEAAIEAAVPVATRVPGDLAALLARHGVELAQIDAFAVATGPGSFTGLRIGIATMQGLAVAGGKPLLGVSAFDAFAHLAAAPRVAIWIDAWRGEVYAARYDDGVAAGEPLVGAPQTALDAFRLPTTGTTFIGDGAVRYRELLSDAHVIEPTPLLAGVVARLAAARAAAGETPPPHAIRPQYVRRPDAELARERSSG